MSLWSTFDTWLSFWTPVVSAVRKLIILSDNCSYRTLLFLLEYRQNATSLQCQFQVAISTWMELNFQLRLTISAISVLQI